MKQKRIAIAVAALMLTTMVFSPVLSFAEEETEAPTTAYSKTEIVTEDSTELPTTDSTEESATDATEESTSETSEETTGEVTEPTEEPSETTEPATDGTEPATDSTDPTDATDVNEPEEQIYSNIFKYRDYGDHVVITGTTRTLDTELVTSGVWKSALVLPPDINGVPVTEIGEHAFELQNGIIELILSNSIQKIGAQAFSQCNNLYYIAPLDSKSEVALEEIGDYAFAMSFQTDTMIDLGEFPNLKTIGEGAFHKCGKSISAVKLGANVTSIGNKAFHEANVFKFEVDEGNTAYTAEDGVLYTKDMTRLVQFPAIKVKADFKIPATVTSIAAGAFAKAGDVAKITLPEGLTTIEDGAFYDCAKVKTLDVPASVNYIGYDAFSSMDSLESITIRNKDAVIEDLGVGSTISNAMDLQTLGFSYSGKIIGYTASTAESYAKAHNYTFEALDPPTDNASDSSSNSSGSSSSSGSSTSNRTSSSSSSSPGTASSSSSSAAPKTGDTSGVAAAAGILAAVTFALTKRRRK